MKPDEANKIIAEYMGWYKQSTDKHPHAWNNNEGFRVNKHEWFSESLDALVPVWEKLEYVPLFKQARLSKTYWCKVESIDIGKPTFCSPEGIVTIQEAAAIATAKAIQELK
jgi:hypothetical protein